MKVPEGEEWTASGVTGFIEHLHRIFSESDDLIIQFCKSYRDILNDLLCYETAGGPVSETVGIRIADFVVGPQDESKAVHMLNLAAMDNRGEISISDFCPRRNG